VKCLNRPFPEFGRGVILENVTPDVFTLLLPYGKKPICLGCTEEGGGT
jgi:hypothetical protein